MVRWPISAVKFLQYHSHHFRKFTADLSLFFCHIPLGRGLSSNEINWINRFRKECDNKGGDNYVVNFLNW